MSCPPPRNAPQRLGNRTRGDVSACSALSIGSPPYPFGFPRKPICYLAVGAVVAVGTWCLNISNQTKSVPAERSEEHTSELQSLMRISYAVFCLKKKKTKKVKKTINNHAKIEYRKIIEHTNSEILKN